MKKIDCAFFNAEILECSALNETQCDKCRFYKTVQEFREGQKRARERIRSLPEREYINQKYFGGKM